MQKADKRPIDLEREACRDQYRKTMHGPLRGKNVFAMRKNAARDALRRTTCYQASSNGLKCAKGFLYIDVADSYEDTLAWKESSQRFVVTCFASIIA